MVVTQDLRREGTVASSIRLKTKPEHRYRACFRLTRDDTVTVSMVDPTDRPVRVLARDEPLDGGETAHCFDWDGRGEQGQPLPPGPYRLSLELAEADRHAVSGEKLRVRTP
jgi:flagellar hook assembly protein FlgD